MLKERGGGVGVFSQNDGIVWFILAINMYIYTVQCHGVRAGA